MTTRRIPAPFTLIVNPLALVQAPQPVLTTLPTPAGAPRGRLAARRSSRGLTVLALVAGAALAACSSMPAANAQLDRARSDYRLAQADPQTQQLAPAELKQAADALALADASLARSDDIARTSQLAYLARQRVALAVEAAGRKGAEAQVASAGAERDQLRLAARTQEADAANRNAASANRDAASANRDAASANQNAASANRSAASAQQQTDMANRQSADARQQAAGATQDADRARQDASNARQQTANANQRTQTAQQQAAQMQAKADGAELRNQSLADQLRAMDAKQTDRGMVITMGDMLFDTDQARLKSGGVRGLERLGAFLKAYPMRKAAIEGYTDSMGSDSHNQALSERRAQAVRALLVDMGVGSGQLATQGYGETHPVAGNDSAGGRQMNRRVEVVLSDEAGVVAPR